MVLRTIFAWPRLVDIPHDEFSVPGTGEYLVVKHWLALENRTYKSGRFTYPHGPRRHQCLHSRS